MNPNIERTLKNLALPVYKIQINEEEEMGVNRISYVDVAAISEDFLYFANNQNTVIPFHFATADKDKRLVTGPAMIPDLPIYRSPDKQNPAGYYVYYDAETVQQIAFKFMAKGLINSFNINHTEQSAGATLVESFIAKSRYKEMGYDLPKGTWLITTKINDDEIWNDYIKSGKVKGFSVELLSEYIPVTFSAEEKPKSPLTIISELLKKGGYL